MHELLERFHGDMFLSSLAESSKHSLSNLHEMSTDLVQTAIAIPMGMTADKTVTLAGSTQEILVALRQAEALFSSGLEAFFRRGKVPYIRQAAVSLALVSAFQASLGKSSKHSPNLVVNLLGMFAHLLT